MHLNRCEVALCSFNLTFFYNFDNGKERTEAIYICQLSQFLHYP